MATVDQFASIYSSHQIYLERLAAGMGNDALPYIQSIDDRVMKLFNNLPKKQLSPEQQKEIRKEVNSIIKEELGEMVSAMKLSQKQLGGYEAEWNDEQINAEIESDINTVVPSMTQVSAAAKATPIKVGNGRYTTYGKMYSDYTHNQAERIDGIILNGFANGQTNRDIAKLVEQELPTWQGGAESQARTLARTGTNHYATQARLTYEQENDKVIIGWRSIATIDSGTTTQCASLDGEIMKSDNPKFGAFKPPRHPNCRSAITPEIDGRLKYDDSKAERPTNFTVDGKKDPKRVSSKRTYYNEMKNLSTSDQDEILGPSLGEAFRKMDNPDVFAKQTINQATLEPLTLKQMKKKDNQLGKILRAQER